MSKFQKLQQYLQNKGVNYTFHFIVHKLMGKRIKEKINLLYFLTHNNLSTGYANDLDDWRNFVALRKEYKQFLNALPEYKIFDDQSKNIWWCWLQGEDNAPDLCKSCLQSVRKNFPDYNITVITENNLSRYIEMPEYILNKYNKGIIGRAHFADILRTMLLVKYGGVWIDSTVFCSGRNDDLLKEPLFVFQDWKFNREQACVCSNWFLSARKGDPILRTTLDLVLEYWKRNDFAKNYFFYHLFFHMATERYIDEWNKMPRYSNIPPHILQFELYHPFTKKRFEEICSGSNFHKLTYKSSIKTEDNLDGTFYDYIVKSSKEEF